GAGTTTTNSNGDFSADLNPSAPGILTATVTDQWNQASPAAAATLTNKAPVIQNFVGQALDASVWVFTGRVVDEWAAGLTVTFSGLPALQGKTVTVSSDGTFSLTVDLQDQTGTVSAQVTDWWNANSGFASFDV